MVYMSAPESHCCHIFGNKGETVSYVLIFRLYVLVRNLSKCGMLFTSSHIAIHQHLSTAGECSQITFRQVSSIRSKSYFVQLYDTTDNMTTSRAELINCRAALADRKLISDDQVRIFCEILQFRYRYGERHDTEEGRTIYYNRIRRLLPKLRFPVGSNSGFAWKLILPKQSEYTYLCDLHKGLNADFVHQWFTFLALEIGARLELLRSTGRECVGDYVWDNLVKPLTRLHKMWETKERIHEAFGTFCDAGFEGAKNLISVGRQSDGCEACILARVASHSPTLLALRTAIRSRISMESFVRHPSRLRLLRLIEPWVELWQEGLDKKTGRYDSSVQQVHGSKLLAQSLYLKREKIKLYYDTEVYDLTDVFHQAENDEIDSYTALRASQRLSLSTRLQTSFQGGSSTGLTGERNPYSSKLDPAYHSSRYSDDTSSTFAADLYAPKRSANTDSVQTQWGDVITGGSGASTPFESKASPLERISEECANRDVPSRQGSVRNSVRGCLQGVKPSPLRIDKQGTVDKVAPTVRPASSVYSQDDTPGVSGLCSPVSKLSTQDRYDGSSSVSSVNTFEECYYRQEKPRNPNRESHESQWTTATMDTNIFPHSGEGAMKPRLSRPFDEPAFDVFGSDMAKTRRNQSSGLKKQR